LLDHIIDKNAQSIITAGIYRAGLEKKRRDFVDKLLARQVIHSLLLDKFE
jgi:hypothetical protein